MSNRGNAVAPAQTLTALIVDDEALARDELAYLLKDFPDVDVAASASNGLEAIQLIEDMEPDLVFLDVHMPGLDGLGVIRRLREKDAPLPYFILATAFDHYAVEAFQVEAFDYLLKPVEKDRLAATLERARRSIALRPSRLDAPETEPELPRPPGGYKTKVLVRRDNRNWIVDAADIVYATIDDGLITVVTSALEGESTYKTIEDLQSSLDPEMFWRVHRSWLVNINRIREVVPWFKSSFQLRMDDKKGTEVPVSRVQTKRLRALFRL
ncbi:MAG TPA: LytTR family DNA-binding domain-containing protein [Bryobacteraceae bacterium]|nr:LytTR family DNA-binding domain-containing protein [Bryobacteraceae bacterium]